MLSGVRAECCKINLFVFITEVKSLTLEASNAEPIYTGKLRKPSV